MSTGGYLDPLLATGIALLFGASALAFGVAAVAGWTVGGTPHMEGCR